MQILSITTTYSGQTLPYLLNDGARNFWDEASEGPPVLLIMGLSFTHEMWFRLLPALKPNYRAIFFDNRGMGSDVPPGPYSIRQMASDAVAVLDAADVSAAHIIGASMGGMIAQELALSFPKCVLSLALACTSYSGILARWPDFSRRPRGLNWSTSSRLERERSMRAMLYADSTPDERIEEDIRLRMECLWSCQGFTRQAMAILRWSSYLRLPRIRVPTLVIHGEQDRLVPIQNGRTVAARIPGSRFEVVQNAGHVLVTDQPEACARELKQFLSEQPNGAPQLH